MPVPTGPILTPSPTGKPYAFGWDRLHQWTSDYDAAYARFPSILRGVLEGIGLVESGWKHYNRDGSVLTRPSDSYDRVPAIGMMQVKTYHDRVPESVYTPLGNVLEAAALMDEGIRKHGTWQKAFVSVYFTGTDYQTGTTQAAYVATIEGVLREFAAAARVDTTPTPNPRTPPVNGDGGNGSSPPPQDLPSIPGGNGAGGRTGGNQPAPPQAVDPWRPYPYPPMVDLIVQKPYDGAGFDRVEFRRPLIRGFSSHITDGPQSQTIEWLAEFFGTGGARAYDALTDLAIGADGRIGLLNDWRDPNRGGTRAGWANGGTDGLEGPGIAFYRRFPRINVHLVSCEHCAKAGQAWTDAQLASTIEIRTAIAQELMCPWDSYPNHPAYGVSIEQAHTFFASKSCPAEPYLSTYEPIILAEVAQKLRAHQTGSTNGDPLPPVKPEPVKTYTEYGLTLDTVANLFGVMDRYNTDGSIDELPFNPEGPLSLLWLERSEATGDFPEAESIQLLDSSLTPGNDWFATWEGGWIAVLPEGDTRATWRWLDELKNVPVQP